MLTFLQRARTVPSPPNASSPTAALLVHAFTRTIMFRGQTHVIAFRSSSTLNDSISFDFTGATLPLAHQRPIYVTHTPAALSSTRMPLSLTCLRAGLPVSSSIATVHHLSPTEWGVSATWPLCNSDLGTVRHSPYSSPLTPPPSPLLLLLPPHPTLSSPFAIIPLSFLF